MTLRYPMIAATIPTRISSKLLPMMLCCATQSLQVFLSCMAFMRTIATSARHPMQARQQATMILCRINVFRFSATHRGMISMHTIIVLSRVLRFVQYVPCSAALPVEAYQTLLIPTYRSSAALPVEAYQTLLILPCIHQAILPDMCENCIMEKSVIMHHSYYSPS